MGILRFRNERSFSACNLVISFWTLRMCCNKELRAWIVCSLPSLIASAAMTAAASAFMSISTEAVVMLPKYENGVARCAI